MEDIRVYRITHIDNVPHILKHGVTQKNSSNANPDFRPIGDTSLIDFRSEYQVWVNNGIAGNQLKKISLGDFIPFYFGVRMPMLYVVQNGGNFVPDRIDPDQIIYLALSLDRIITARLEFYFSDGHATDAYTQFYDKDCVDNITDIIDWKSIKTRYWGGEGQLDVKRKKQAELLVKNDVPPTCLVGYGCYSEESFIALTSLGIAKSLIKVIPNAYF